MGNKRLASLLPSAGGRNEKKKECSLAECQGREKKRKKRKNSFREKKRKGGREAIPN